VKETHLKNLSTEGDDLNEKINRIGVKRKKAKS
jgi:hypothetical protein